MEVIVWGDLYGQTTMSLFHYKLLGPNTVTDGREVCSELLAALGTAGGLFDQYAQCCAAPQKFTLTSAQWIKSLRYARYDQLPTYTGGTQAAEAVAPNIAVALTKRSNSEIGRSARGTLHMPGVPSNWVEEGELNTVGYNSYLELALEVKRQQSGGGGTWTLDPVIFQLKNPPESITIDNVEPMYAVRCMRRRTVGRGI